MPKLTKTQTQGIKDVMLAKEVSLKDLAQQVGTSVAALGNQIRGKDSVSDARLASIHNALGMGAANPKSVPKSVPETLERPVITLDEVQAIRAEQKRLGQRCEEIREAVGELLASKNGSKDESYAQALEKRVDLVVDELSGAFQMLQELRLASESRPACVIESESLSSPDDDFEAARAFEEQAKAFARRCPHLFRAACSRVMAVAYGS